MEKLIIGLIVVAGLINFYPVVGILSSEILFNLYKIDSISNDVLILLKHRAILFGFLGGFIIYSAFKPELQIWGIILGLASMLPFIVIALFIGNYGVGIQKIVVADVIASIGLIIALALRLLFIKSGNVL